MSSIGQGRERVLTEIETASPSGQDLPYSVIAGAPLGVHVRLMRLWESDARDECLDLMKSQGGSFAVALADALYVADPRNTRRLLAAMWYIVWPYMQKVRPRDTWTEPTK